MPPLFSFFAVFFWFLNSHALNVTIDDTHGDSSTGALVTYTPPDAWTESGNLPCTQLCPPGTPNVQDMVDYTYHNSTFSPNSGSFPNVPLTASVNFDGSAVYVYCALSPNANSDMTFFLDGAVVGNFVQPAVDEFQYGVLVYSNPSITPGLHTLTLQNGQQNGNESVMILDSIVYTSIGDETAPLQAPSPSASAATSSASAATSSSRRGPPAATLAVIAVLVVALLIMLAVLGVCLYRRNRRRRAVYATYMPKGAVRAFPAGLSPSPASSRPMSPAYPAEAGGSRSPAIAPLPPTYAGGSGGNWWTGRDQKSRDGVRVLHRPFEDLDPSQAVLQHPPAWERKTSYPY
ncbi:hypothetical protein K438DRAFT_2009737 [Mycena galopus ATCC 62051]|nr:hypothetical protein K438DRAFT_2009737 [Mycena galopus ATCC 62051]